MNVDWGHDRVEGGAPLLAGIEATAWCLHPDRAAGRLAGVMSIPQWQPGSPCRLVGLLAHPGQWIEASYEFQGRASSVPAVLTVRYCREGKSARAFAEAVATAADPTAIVHVSAFEAVAWRFPEDSHLRSLSRLDGPAWRARLSQPGSASAGEAERWSTTVLSYRRGARCALRVDPPDADGVVVKVHAGAADAHATLGAVFDRASARLGMPRPLGVDPEQGVRWETFVPGQSFIAQMRTGPVGAAVHAVAGALGRLHGIEVQGLPVQDAPSTLTRLERVALTRVARAGLSVADRHCQLVADRLARRLPTPPSSPATLHGDLHVGNVLFTTSGAALVDLDSLACGDPTIDLAMFASRLLLLAALRGSAATDVIQAACDMPTAYREHHGPVDEEAFAWFMAALLVARQIKTCINHAAPSLAQTTEALAGAALDILDRGRCDADALTRHLCR